MDHGAAVLIERDVTVFTGFAIIMLTFPASRPSVLPLPTLVAGFLICGGFLFQLVTEVLPVWRAVDRVSDLCAGNRSPKVVACRDRHLDFFAARIPLLDGRDRNAVLGPSV